MSRIKGPITTVKNFYVKVVARYVTCHAPVNKKVNKKVNKNVNKKVNKKVNKNSVRYLKIA